MCVHVWVRPREREFFFLNMQLKKLKMHPVVLEYK